MTPEERRKRRAESNRKYRETHKASCATYAKRYREAHKKPPADAPSEKVCRNCRATKPLDEFYPQRRVTGARPPRGGFGVDQMCKACRSHVRKPTLKAQRARTLEMQQAGMKMCNVCLTIKPMDHFNVRRASPDGLCYTCGECSKRRTKTWSADHPSAFSEWHEKNKDHRRKSWSAWRHKNADRLNAAYRRWAADNPDKVLANLRRRELSKRHATPAWADRLAILAFYTEAARLTRETGIRHNVDHIVPLRSKTVCGLHVACNLQILTRADNLKKSNHHEATFTSPAAIDLRLTAASKLATLSSSDCSG